MNDLIIRKGHPIVEASYKLSLTEQRMILLSLAKLDNRDIKQRKVTLYVQEYVKAFNVDETIAYRDLSNASKRLYERSIILKNEDETTEFRWIESRTKYHKGEGRISFEFSTRVLPYLFELDKRLGYTQYELLSVSGFKSIYSIRMYELVKKIQGMQNQVIEINEIRRMLQVSDKYSDYKFFNRDILKVSLKEINNKSDLLVDVEPVKRGRKIVSLKFNIAKKENKKTICRPKFPHKNKYGRYVKLDIQNPKMSSAEYGNYAQDCLKILDKHYQNIDDVILEDLRNYWVFLSVNQSFKSKVGKKSDFLDKINKQGYKLVNCELCIR